LLGDPDQLASVEAGAVLGDICNSSLDDVVVKLVESHRFKDEGGIGRLASRIRRGDVEGVLEVLSHDDEAAQFVELPQASPFAIEPLLERIGFGYEALRRARTPEEALTALDRFRVLCVHRRGRFGVETWNDRLEERTVRFERSRSARPCARPLLVRENAEDSSLYNGDLGVLFTDSGERAPRAYFRSTGGAVSTYAVGRLPGHERAFAMSVHKSQGSEVDEVLVILPDATSPLLTRELLYTAVTRARKRCVIVGTREALKRCVQGKVMRQSGLSETLRASRMGQ
jgi:exodeoxyribonuclease V alpha subunit